MMGYLMRGAVRQYYNEMRRTVGHWKNSLMDTYPKLLVLTYHRILPKVGFDPLGTVVSLKVFERQIDRLASRFPVVSLSEAVSRQESGSAIPREQIVLTFDDGYWDNYEIVFPLLKKLGLPAVFFLATDYVEGKAVFADPRVINRKTGRPHDYINDRFINWEEARHMSDAGMEIGSHGVTHRSLGRMPVDRAREEIVKSKEIIERSLNTQCRHFAFPFGSRQDYDQPLVDFVEKTGYRSCLLNVHGYNHPKTDKFCLRRIIMEESTNVAHILG